MLRIRNLSKSFGKNVLFTDLSFEVSPGEKVALSAPSGAGKTTLLRILCGLEKADGGTVEGVNPGNVAYLFQEPRLFPQLTALENVTCIFPRPKEHREAAEELLCKLGLADAIHQYPHELSGGMKQRVALARTLLADRPVVLLDEPFTALDGELKESLRKLVAEHCKDKILILVSHDPEDLLLADRTISF